MFGLPNSSRGASFVAMVQTAHLWEGDNGACRRWLYGARLRTILVEREMCSALVMIYPDSLVSQRLMLGRR